GCCNSENQHEQLTSKLSCCSHGSESRVRFLQSLNSQLSTTVFFGFLSPMPKTKTSPAGQRIRGVLAPVVTPFKADLSPSPQRLVRHCQWLLSQNCGLAVFGTNSEANSMSAKERMTLLDALVAAGIDPSRMMPGTGCCSITETVELTANAVKHS